MPSPARRPSAIVSPFGGEDGDFIQLRIEREKKKVQRTPIKNTTVEPSTSDKTGSLRSPIQKGSAGPNTDVATGTKDSKQPNKGLVAVRALNRMKKGANDKNNEETLQRKLFKAIDENNVEKFNQKRSKHGVGLDLETIRDSKTDMNVLHYAIEKNCVVIATSLIQEGNTNLIRSKYTLQHSGITAYRNILHILIKRGDRDMVEYILNQVADIEVETDMLTLETLVLADDLRPHLLPCLHLAAYHGHASLVEVFLVRYSMDINSRNSKSETALMWATRGGHVAIVQMLIKRGADSNLDNDKGTTAFYWAVRYNHLDIARTLIHEGKADPHRKRKSGLFYPLIVASAYGNSEMVNLILSQSAVDVNVSIRGGETALHYATRGGYTDIVNMLLDKSASPDKPDEMGDTPLLIATKYGHIELANIFIYKGARLDQRNHEGYDIWQYAIDCEGVDFLEALVVTTQDFPYPGRQPLNIAASMGNIDKVEFLIQAGLDTQSTDKDGNSFLHFAAMYDQHEVIKRFYSRELIDLQNKKGNTVFHIACYRGYENSIRALVELKAYPGVINNNGETVLHSAAYSNQIIAETVKMLVEYTVNEHSWDVINMKDYLGNNCLHIAARHAMPDVVWEFRPASIKDQDKDGMTPLHHSVRSDEPEVLETMLDVFELARRDVRIDEQTFASRETVLHFAADKCHMDAVKRLINLGADISERDYGGNTVLHRVILSCVQDSHRKLQYLAVFDVILENIVTWWCISNHVSIPYENDGETLMRYRVEAIIHISHNVLNNDGMSVCDIAFAVGCPEVLSQLLMTPDVTYFITEDRGAREHVFDVSGLMPRTLRTSRSVNKTSTIKQKSKTLTSEKLLEEETTLLPSQSKSVSGKKLSGMDWLMTCSDTMKTGEILDLPPVEIIERHYSSIVAWTFTSLLLLHIAYMAIFTYVGIDTQSAIRNENLTTNFSSLLSKDTAVLYFIVPLEPLIIVLFSIYLIIRYCCTGDIRRRMQLSKKQSVWMVLTVLTEYMLPLIYFSFAILVFLWIVLVRSGYKHQDSVLAVAICIGWLLSICFTRGIKMVHYFYKMLLGIIIRDVFRFLLVYMFVLLAISLALHVLFQASDDVIEVYQTPGSTMFMTFNLMMGMGEMFDGTLQDGLKSVNKTTDLIQILYVLYIVLGSLVMLNVLIAMMNDSYSNVLREGSANWRIDSIRLGMEIERSFAISRVFSSVSTQYGLLGSLPKKRWSVTISDSDMQAYFHMLERKALQPDALTKRIDTIEQRTVAIEKLLTQNLQQITEALQTKRKKPLFKKRFGLFGKGQGVQ